MSSSLTNHTKNALQKHKRKKRWQKVLSVLAAVVVFVTTYMLILPAITLENNVVCGKEEHTHTEDCYTIKPETKELTCTLESLELHKHTSACYDAEKNLICGIADYVVHTHDENCYDETGKLICVLAEIKEHQHTDSCYSDGELICAEQEVALHEHTAACYDETGILTCGMLETKEHQHTDDCFNTTLEIKELVCKKEEHQHTEQCYETEEKKVEGQSGETEDIIQESSLPVAEVNAVERSYSLMSGRSISALPENLGEDFEQYITEVTVQKIVNGNWTESTEFKNGDQVRVTLNYSIPAGIITSTSKTIHYQLPAGVLPNESLSGRVYWQGKDVGDYYIDESGMIVIIFDDSFAEGGEAIDGDIYFEGTVSSDNTGEDKEIQFGGDGGTIIIKKDEEEQQAGDINIDKQSTISEDRNSITYKVTIGTTNGTGKEVKFEDWLTNGTFNSDSIVIEKIDASGNSSSITGVTPVIEASNNQQHLVIDALQELQSNETYVITYTVTPGTADSDGKLYVTNYACANGASKWNETKVSEKVITKSGYYDEDAEKITWTVTINPGGQNLNGYTLSDTLDGNELTNKTAILKNETTGTSTEISLPYVFSEDTTDVYSYTIVYETEVSHDSNTVNNSVELSNGTDQSYSTGSNVGITKRDWGLNKSKISEEKDSDGNQKYKWQTNITLPNQSISSLESFVYTDMILGDDGQQNEDVHYGTVDDISNLISETLTLQYVESGEQKTVSFKSNTNEFEKYFKYEIKFYNTTGSEVSGESSKVTSFKITFIPQKDNIEGIVGKTIYFNYPTTGVTSNVAEGTTITLKNVGEIPNHSTEASVNYTNPQRLQKASSGTGFMNPPTEFVYVGNDSTWNGFKSDGSSVELDSGDSGMLYYRLIIRPDSNDSDIVLQDMLPEGVHYVEESGYALYCSVNDSGLTAIWPSEGGHDLTVEDNKPTFTQQDHLLTIKLPAGFKTNWPIAIFYAVSIDNGAIQGGEIKDFVNSVSWGERSASTTTTVTKEKEIVAKVGEQLSTTDESGNVVWLDEVEYNVVINPTKDNLDINSDTLTLYDTLTYSNLDGIYLDLSNVQLYTYDLNNAENNYKGELIDSSRYQVAYNNVESGKQVLTVKLPDELACVLTYRYTYDKGSSAVGSIQINNEVNLAGKSSKVENLELKDNISGAHVNKTKIKIYKVDSEDYSKLLQGAEFQLLSYHKQGEEGFENAPGWKPHTPNLVTDENGEFVLEADSSATAGEVLRENTLYKLKEISAPKGYIKTDKEYYFVWLNDKQTLETLWWSLNVETRTEIGVMNNIQVLGKNGGNIYIPNEYTSIGVQKVWLDQNGVAIDPGIDEIQVQLMQNTKVSDGYHVKIQFSSAYGKEINICVKKGTSIKLTVEQPTWSVGQENQWYVTKNNERFEKKSEIVKGCPTIETNEIVEDNCTLMVYGYLETNTPVTVDFTDPDYIVGEYEKVGEPIRLNDENQWTYVWENLQKQNESGEGLYYSVEEITAVNGYLTSYTNNNGIQDGEIVITNTKEEKTDFTLPETGGSGTIKYIMGGILLMLASVLLYINQHIKEGRRRHIRR